MFYLYKLKQIKEKFELGVVTAFHLRTEKIGDTWRGKLFIEFNGTRKGKPAVLKYHSRFANLDTIKNLVEPYKGQFECDYLNIWHRK